MSCQSDSLMKTRKKSLHVRVEEALRKICSKGVPQPHTVMFKALFRRLRKKKKLSKKHLARRTKLRTLTVGNLEKRRGIPNTDTTVRVSLAMDYFPHELWFMVHEELVREIMRKLRGRGALE